MNLLHSIVPALGAVLISGPVLAADWAPTKPIRFIVGFPPGGATDLVARILQPKLTASLGTQVVVENRPGANGVISLQALNRADPDGHTIGMSPFGSLIVSPTIQNVQYDPIESFVHVGMLVTLQNILITHPSVPVRSLKEYIALAKAEKGKLNFASSGVGSPGHLAGALLEMMTDITLTHVPYKGGGPAITDLIAGHVPSFIAVISTAVPHVRSGRARALAVTGAKRAEALPDVATIAEAGVKGYQAVNWYGLSTPAKTPAAVVERLNRDFSAALGMPDVVRQLKDRGIDATPTSGAEYRDFVRSEQKRWAPVIKKAGIEPN